MALALFPLVAYCFLMAHTIAGDAVRQLRQANGWSLRQFAEVAELSPGFLSKIENGIATGTPATMVQIAQALGVEPPAVTGDRKAYTAALKAAYRSPKAVRIPRARKAVA